MIIGIMFLKITWLKQIGKKMFPNVKDVHVHEQLATYKMTTMHECKTQNTYKATISIVIWQREDVKNQEMLYFLESKECG